MAKLLTTLAQDRQRKCGLIELQAHALVNAMFQSLLGRPAEEQVLAGYCRSLMESGDVERLVLEIAQSTEHREHILPRAQQAALAIAETFQCLLGRPPSEEEVATHLSAFDNGMLVADVANTAEAWAHQLSRRARELIVQMNEGLGGAALSEAELDVASQQFEASKDIAALLTSLSAGRRSRRGLIEIEAAAMVDSGFKALLGRPAEGDALAGYTRLLLETANIEGFLHQVGHSPEHIDKLRPRADLDRPAIMGLFLGLLEREPSEDELAARLAALQEGVEYTTLVTEVVATPEFTARFASNVSSATDLVRAIHIALLSREPDAQSLAHYVQFLRDGGAAVDVLKAVAGSDEHWIKQLDAHSEFLVRLGFEALLHREPDEQALLSYSQSVRGPGKLLAFLREVGSSREHREKLLRAMVAKRA